MIQKRITTTGKVFSDINALKVWEKNPRFIEHKEDFERLKRQVQELGQYKPLLVTEDGIVVGGNMRLKAMQELKFQEVWITELSFGVEEQTQEQIAAGEPKKYRALIDNKVQEKVASSVEQIMLEYALSDNDAVGMYNQQELAELINPYQQLMPMENYKLVLSPEVKMKTFLDQYQGKGEVPNLNNEQDKNEAKKDKKIVFRVEYSPDQFKEIEPLLEQLKSKLGAKSNSDLLTYLLEIAVEKVSGDDELENKISKLDVNTTGHNSVESEADQFSHTEEQSPTGSEQQGSGEIASEEGSQNG